MGYCTFPACLTAKAQLNAHMLRSIRIFGAAFMRPQLEPLLKWATPGQRGFTDAMRQAANPMYTMTTKFSTPSPDIGSSISATPEVAMKTLIDAQKRATELRNMLDMLTRVDDGGRRG